MRNISFALTTDQVRSRTKTVSRRLGWQNLKPGTLLQPVVKAQGLRKGEHVEKIGGPIRVVSVRREPLARMTQDPDYGIAECRAEGFADHPELRWPSAFVEMFCRTHKLPALYDGDRLVVSARRCLPGDEVTRIEFVYVD